MTFELKTVGEYLHVQYEVIFCWNNMAVSLRVLCTLVGKQKVYKFLMHLQNMIVRDFNFYVLMVS